MCKVRKKNRRYERKPIFGTFNVAHAAFLLSFTLSCYPFLCFELKFESNFFYFGTKHAITVNSITHDPGCF